MDNCFLFDWLTVSFEDLGFADIIGLLGMQEKTWEEQKTGSRLRYGHRLAFDGISIHYTDNDDLRHNQGVCLEMSGQGCRDFESFGSSDWIQLFDDISEFHGKITRLDVAYDDFTGVLPIDIIADMARQGLFTSRMQRCQIFFDWANHGEPDRCGLTIMHGSRSSDCSIRIYDKRAERGAWDEFPHWVRLEMQLRSGCGQGFLDRLLEVGSLGETFAGVLCNYLTYRCPTSDSNKRRAPAAPWWCKFVRDAAALRIHEVKGVEYNKKRLLDHIDRNHNAIKTAILSEGLGEFVASAFGHTEPLPEKYKHILQANENGDQILAVLRQLPSVQIATVCESL